MNHLFFRRVVRYTATLLLFSLLGCTASASARKRKPRKVKRQPQIELTQQTAITGALAQLIRTGEQLLGRPYRYRGVSGWTFDCSGYVGYLYSTLGIKIPRSSAAISAYTQRIKHPQPGDLLFFKGRNSGSSRVGHVALVVDSNNGDPIIMHSTNSRGIIKHRLSTSKYFSKRYLFAGRLPGVEHIVGPSPDSTASTPSPAAHLSEQE